MSAQLDLFGVVAEAPVSANYHETYDPDDPGCADCAHLRLIALDKRSQVPYPVPDRCAILRRVVDADFGTCGRFQATQEDMR